MTRGSYHPGFEDKRVVNWEPGNALVDQNTTLHCLRIDHEGDGYSRWADKFADFLRMAGSSEISELVVGGSRDAAGDRYYDRVVKALVAACNQLPQLTSLLW